MEICKVSTFKDFHTMNTQLRIYAKMNVSELKEYKMGDESFDEYALKVGKEFLEQLTLNLMKMDPSEIKFINRELTY